MSVVPTMKIKKILEFVQTLMWLRISVREYEKKKQSVVIIKRETKFHELFNCRYKVVESWNQITDIVRQNWKYDLFYRTYREKKQT